MTQRKYIRKNSKHSHINHFVDSYTDYYKSNIDTSLRLCRRWLIAWYFSRQTFSCLMARENYSGNRANLTACENV